MLENLRDLVKQYAGDAIITNPAIPNERNDEAVDTAADSIMNGLQQSATNGNTADVVGLLDGDPQNALDSPVTSNIKGNFVENLIQKFGLDQGKASQIASALIPIVLQQFAKKTKDPNDKSFDLQDILGKLGGGGAGGLMDKLKGMF